MGGVGISSGAAQLVGTYPDECMNISHRVQRADEPSTVYQQVFHCDNTHGRFTSSKSGLTCHSQSSGTVKTIMVFFHYITA